MDLRKIKKLIELVEESGIAELEVKSGEEAVRITMKPSSDAGGVSAAATSTSAVTAIAAPAEAPGHSQPASQSDSASPEGKPLESPLSGTFYAAPSPDAQNFVAVGDRVSPSDVVCIVESMKMMNRIEADRSGTVTAVLVPNGEPVESGQPLFLIDD